MQTYLQEIRMKQMELDRKLTEAKPAEAAPKNKPGVPLAPGRDKILKKQKEDAIRKENNANSQPRPVKKPVAAKPVVQKSLKTTKANDEAVDAEMQDLKA